jgi:hypothetical protein
MPQRETTTYEAKWTAGPWSACCDGDCSCALVWCPDYPIASVTRGEWGDEYPRLRIVGDSTLEEKAEPYIDRIVYGAVNKNTAAANARLIAAAPELYDALECLMRILDEASIGSIEYTAARVTARAVLTKAREGRELTVSP